MDKIELHIAGMDTSQSYPGNYVLILEDAEGKRRLPIIIGECEAKAIATSLEKLVTKRPLTHDLFHRMMQQYALHVEQVLIYQVQEERFYTRIRVKGPDARTEEIECRPSDAFALAVRFACPIYALVDILENLSYWAKPDSLQIGSEVNYDLYPLPELELLLKKALAEEKYEEAKRIQASITRKSNN